ncbi:hypothetical protein SLE2022_402870 [Rubroshorea leprosula]
MMITLKIWVLPFRNVLIKQMSLLIILYKGEKKKWSDSEAVAWLLCKLAATATREAARKAGSIRCISNLWSRLPVQISNDMFGLLLWKLEIKALHGPSCLAYNFFRLNCASCL